MDVSLLDPPIAKVFARIKIRIELTQTGDKRFPCYKQIYLGNACFSEVVRFVVAQFIAPCVSAEEVGK